MENVKSEQAKIHYMKCEYFFSLNPKSECDCKNCIYSERDFCPADLERYKPFCDE